MTPVYRFKKVVPFNFVESKLNNLTINLNNKSGRNNLGQITIRHRGGRRN